MLMLDLVVGQTGCHWADKICMVVCMVKYSLPTLVCGLLQTSLILHNTFEPSKHDINITLSFVMPLKLSLDMIARILTRVLYVKEQEPCRQPFPPAPGLCAGLGSALGSQDVAAGRMQCYMKRCLPLML